MDVKGLRRPVPVRVPHSFQDDLAGKGCSGVFGEECEKVKLFAGECEFFSVMGHPTASVVDDETMTEINPGFFVRGTVSSRAASHGPDARHEFPEAERFHHVVVGTEFESDNPVHLVAPGAHDDHGDLGSLPNLSADAEPVHVGKPEVQEHDVEAGVTIDEGEGVATQRQSCDGESFMGQPTFEGLSNGVIVFDDQYTHQTSVTRLPAGWEDFAIS